MANLWVVVLAPALGELLLAVNLCKVAAVLVFQSFRRIPNRQVELEKLAHHFPELHRQLDGWYNNRCWWNQGK